MSKILQKAMKSRGGKIAVQKPVTRNGKTFQQTFWVSPREAMALRGLTQQKQESKFAKAKRLNAPQKSEEDKAIQHSVDNLILYMDNDAKMYSDHRRPLEKKLARLWENDAYKTSDATAWFQRIVNLGTRNHVLDHGPKSIDTSEVMRNAAAKRLEARFRDEAERGEHDRKPRNIKSMLPKSDKKKGEMRMSDAHETHLEDSAYELGLDPDNVSAAYSAPEGYEFQTSRMSGRDRGATYHLNIDGHIVSEDGTLMGEMKRTLVRMPNGDIHAQHNLLWLKPHAQETGIGTKMVLNQFESYEEMGVSEISLSTDRVGKYLWMKLGFKPEAVDQRDIRSSGGYFIDSMRDQGQIDADQHEVITEMLQGDLNNFARMEGLPTVFYSNMQTGQEEEWPINKALFLTGGSWSGRMEVGGPDWDTTKEILYGYVN